MLDVHPPHHPTHSWRDFFIHIATIVVGLLIAVGLEQTVEWLHHKHELNEVREQLAEERDLNARLLDRNAELDTQVNAELEADIVLLRARLARKGTPLPGKLHYQWGTYALQSGAWQTASATAVVVMLPEKERLLYSYRYDVIHYYMESTRALNATLEHAAAIVNDTPDGNFSPDETSDLIRLTHQAQGELYLEASLQNLTRRKGLAQELDYGFLNQPARKLY